MVSARAGAAGHAAEDGAAWFNLRANVIRVIDGDTLQVRIGRRTARVPILGIFAPHASACFGPEAAVAAKALAQGKRVRLVGDRTQPRRDRLRRLLAYVTLPNGRDLGRRLIAGGYARVWFGDPFGRGGSYDVAERAAMDAGLGLWSACVEPPPGGSADLAVAIADAPDPIVVGRPAHLQDHADEPRPG